MAKTIKEERLRWVLPIINKEIKLVDVAKVYPYGKISLKVLLLRYFKVLQDSTLNPTREASTMRG